MWSFDPSTTPADSKICNSGIKSEYYNKDSLKFKEESNLKPNLFKIKIKNRGPASMSEMITKCVEFFNYIIDGNIILKKINKYFKRYQESDH